MRFVSASISVLLVIGACDYFDMKQQLAGPGLPSASVMTQQLPYVENFEWMNSSEGVVVGHVLFSSPMNKESVENAAFVYRITGDMAGGRPSIEGLPEEILRRWWNENYEYFLEVRLSGPGQYVMIIGQSAVDVYGSQLDGQAFGDTDADFAFLPADSVSPDYVYQITSCPKPVYTSGLCYVPAPGRNYVSIGSIYVMVADEIQSCGYSCRGGAPPSGSDCGLVECGDTYDGCHMESLFYTKSDLDTRYFRINFQTPTPAGVSPSSLVDAVNIYDYNSGEPVRFEVGFSYNKWYPSVEDIPEWPREGIHSLYIKPLGLKEGRTYVLSINENNAIVDVLGNPLRDLNFDGILGGEPEDRINLFFTTHTCAPALSLSQVFCDTDQGRCTIFLKPTKGETVPLRESSVTSDTVRLCYTTEPSCTDPSCCTFIPRQKVKAEEDFVGGVWGNSIILSFEPRKEMHAILFLSHIIADVNGRLLDGNGNLVAEGNSLDDVYIPVEP